MMDVDKLIDNAEAYGEGMKQGKEMAIKNYDKLFLDLYQKMQDIENKLDSFIYGLEKFTKKKASISTELQELRKNPEFLKNQEKYENMAEDYQESTKNEVNSQQNEFSKLLNETRLSSADIHSQNKELMDKDYTKDKQEVKE